MNAPLPPEQSILGATSCVFPVERMRAGARSTACDDLAEETPVAIEYNGIAYATMLATPADLEDFVRGFSLTEGVVRAPRDIYDIEIDSHRDGLVARVEIASACISGLRERRRAMAGRTGCGICGIESLQQLRCDTAVVTRAPQLGIQAAHRAARQLYEHQSLHHITGATHAAGWANAAGVLLALREDVGRHNALDKLIGALHRSGADRATGFALVSSRASYELVQKAAAAGIGVLAAMSAPTARAVRLAGDLGVTLIGFLRDESCVAYSHAQRIIG